MFFGCGRGSTASGFAAVQLVLGGRTTSHLDIHENSKHNGYIRYNLVQKHLPFVFSSHKHHLSLLHQYTPNNPPIYFLSIVHFKLVDNNV